MTVATDIGGVPSSGAATVNTREVGGEVDAITDPWTYASLTAAEIAYAAADLPLLIAPNAARDSVVEPQWRSGGAWDTGVDETLEDTVIRWGGERVYDGEATVPSQREISVITATTALIFELDAATFDTIAIWCPGLADTDCSDVLVEIADDDAFTANLQAIAQWGGDYTRRLVETQLGVGLHTGVTDGARYTNVRYLRITFTVTYTETIRVTEVYLGTRYSPPHRQDDEIDEEANDSVVLVAEADSGHQQRVPRLTRRLNTVLRWQPDDDDYVALFEDFFAATRWGLDSCLYIPRPDFDERVCYLCRVRPDYAMTNIAGETNTIEVGLTELAPFVSKEN